MEKATPEFSPVEKATPENTPVENYHTGVHSGENFKVDRGTERHAMAIIVFIASPFDNESCEKSIITQMLARRSATNSICVVDN